MQNNDANYFNTNYGGGNVYDKGSSLIAMQEKGGEQVFTVVFGIYALRSACGYGFPEHYLFDWKHYFGIAWDDGGTYSCFL